MLKLVLVLFLTGIFQSCINYKIHNTSTQKNDYVFQNNVYDSLGGLRNLLIKYHAQHKIQSLEIDTLLNQFKYKFSIPANSIVNLKNMSAGNSVTGSSFVLLRKDGDKMDTLHVVKDGSVIVSKFKRYPLSLVMPVYRIMN